ncbi:replication-relaxation family protein [Streptomonospora salina]|uniref:Protein involved in plasmid replication-relaxation n=1 Tax=Streptomonospora salina TaxID=104205 RepID=A0A841EBS3_9ACTN|nr:replication-relaxation family protein [Streptomonospora salina]MBB5998468.1 hypothetical protein [Streptomonospora salina]
MTTHTRTETEPEVAHDRLAELARLLTDRDRAIVADVGDHRVMTTHHLARLHFTGPDTSRARRRLAALHRYGLLDRFRPILPPPRGTAPWHWVLAAAGEHVYADIHELDQPARRPGSRIRLANSTHLHHTLGLADCYTAFRVAERRAPGAELARWRTEADCARRWGRHIRPDAYLRWHQHGRGLEAFLEYDNGTEHYPQVVRKLRGYTDHARAHRRTAHILFVAPTRTRTDRLADALAPHTSDRVVVHVTTADLLQREGPEAPIWRPAHEDAAEPLHAIAT